MFNKKSFTVALAVVLAFASIAACAVGPLQREWRIKGYDVGSYVRGDSKIAIEYVEFDENGFPTGREVKGYDAITVAGKVGFAQAELKNPWVSIDYPNNEFVGLYADGTFVGKYYATGRNGVELVNYKNVDFMWEAAAPYRIYSVTKANLFINGAAQWYSNDTYPVQYTGRNAQVKVERIPYGFGAYKVVGDNAIELIPAHMDGYVAADVAGFVGLTAADLAPKAEAPAAIDVTGKEIFVPKSYDVKLTGPAFDAEGNAIADGKVIIGSDIKTVNPANLGFNNVIDTCKTLNGATIGAEITWTQSDYQAAYGYADYEFLTIDGVVMDGRAEAGFYRPYIFRYIGSYSNPYANPDASAVKAIPVAK